MKYADTEEMDISGIDFLRCLRCMYIAGYCRNQRFKMISVEDLK